MPQDGTPAEIKAEASSEETKQFVRRVRRVTRRKFSPADRLGERIAEGAPAIRLS